MLNSKALQVLDAFPILGGGVEIPAADVVGLKPTSYTARAAVVYEETVKAHLWVGEGKDRMPVEFTATIKIQRPPITDDERAIVGVKEAAQKDRKAKEEQAEIDAQAAHSKALEAARSIGVKEATNIFSDAARVLPALKSAIGS